MRLDDVLAAWRLRRNMTPPDGEVPMLWCQHWDRWGESVGELSIDTVDTGSGLAIMAPFLIVPDIEETWLVADMSTLDDRVLTAIRISVDDQGITYDFWTVPFTVDDYGTTDTGPYEMTILTDPTLRRIVTLSVEARGQGGMLDPSLSFANAVQVAIEMLHALDT